MLRQRAQIILLPLLFLVLIFGISRLFKLRFDHGDVYPHYSSYRADPLGTKAFYQALDEMPDIEVSRYHEQGYRKLPHGKGHTLVTLRVEPSQLVRMYLFSIENLELFMRQGGRVVIGVAPYPTKSFMESQEEKLQQREEKKRRQREELRRKQKKKKDEKDEEEELEKIFPEEEPMYQRKDVKDKWGISLDWRNLNWDEEYVAQSETVVLEADSPRELPGMLEWHSAGVFTIPDEIADAWKVHYRRGNSPVLIERRVGLGSVVLATDPFVFSNEALQESRHTSLLTWFLADNRNIIFDESHFGMVRREGVASLGRKYQLHGLIAGLVILGLLFVWKNSTSLVPPIDDVIASGAVTGRDSNEGFLNLLRRTIKPYKLLTLCVAEWCKSHPHLKEKGNALQQMSQFDRPQRDVVGRYHELRELLKPRVK